MDAKKFFLNPNNPTQKQYEALRCFFVENMSAAMVAKQFGYRLTSFYSLIRDFKKNLKQGNEMYPFFVNRKPGRKPKDTSGQLNEFIIGLRKKYLSVPDIKAACDVKGYQTSEKYIYIAIKNDGFERLPRRNQLCREQGATAMKMQAPVSYMLDFEPERFVSQDNLSIVCLLPFLQRYGIDKLIAQSDYPETNTIDKLSSILSFVALKLSNVKRYSADDVWCMDRGKGLFAKLNVLPKTAWYSSYSSRVTRKSNLEFLKGLHKIWQDHNLLTDTANLDFTTIPYWGDSVHLENNWSGKRNKGLSSILAVLAQEPDSGIITYGDTNVRHENESDVVIEFLDFYRNNGNTDIKYLIFDSKFTTYQNLDKLSKDIKFITIRRRGKKIIEQLDSKPNSAWKKIKVLAADGKNRTLKVLDEKISLTGFGGQVRQIAITGNGKIKPALIITNDFDLKCEEIVRKYARRWLVEKGISEQIEFFHLNRVSSSMVIKVDFDLTMSILAHNLIRIISIEIPGYSHCSDTTFYNKFLSMSGTVEITTDTIIVKLKKRRNLPALLTVMQQFQNLPLKVFKNKKLQVIGDSTT